MEHMLKLENVAKEFVLHAQGGTRLPVFDAVSLTVDAGDCVALCGPSGVGKSTLMRMIYGNFRCASGHIFVDHEGRLVDIAAGDPRDILDVRRLTLGYVSQFLRVIPRIATLDVVAEPARARGVAEVDARDIAAGLLRRLNIPENLWPLSPVTFSGGEQQRVNLARGFIAGHPILLLDEPTASLDAGNRETVLKMIAEARDLGTAIVGIFHDDEARKKLCTREIDMGIYATRAA